MKKEITGRNKRKKQEEKRKGYTYSRKEERCKENKGKKFI